MHDNDLFTAPQVAKICSTDLKTIHNWVNRGEIRFFRTPGRHLRFRREDIQDFLKKFGYPVPEGFQQSRPRVIVIDNSRGSIQSLERALSQEVEVEAFTDHLDALIAIGKQAPSLVLINGTCDPQILKVVERIKLAEKDLLVAVYGSDGELESKSIAAGANNYIGAGDPKSVYTFVTQSVLS